MSDTPDRDALLRQLQATLDAMPPVAAMGIRIAGYDNGPRMPAPCLGEHTYDVLTEILGYDVARVWKLLERLHAGGFIVVQSAPKKLADKKAPAKAKDA